MNKETHLKDTIQKLHDAKAGKVNKVQEAIKAARQRRQTQRVEQHRYQ